MITYRYTSRPTHKTISCLETTTQRYFLRTYIHYKVKLKGQLIFEGWPIRLLLISTYSTLSPTLLPRPTSLSSPASESDDSKHSGDNNLDIVQPANNFGILVRAVIGIVGLIGLIMSTYFVRSMYNQSEEAGVEINFSMFFCNQINWY